jgi:glycosyltransferase involved in cell wall biosynthesis
VSGIPVVIEDEETGLLLEYGDKDGLVEEIKTVAEDEKLREYLGKNARKRIKERYNIEMTIDRYIQLYRDMMNNSEF